MVGLDRQYLAYFCTRHSGQRNSGSNSTLTFLNLSDRIETDQKNHFQNSWNKTSKLFVFCVFFFNFSWVFEHPINGFFNGILRGELLRSIRVYAFEFFYDIVHRISESPGSTSDPLFCGSFLGNVIEWFSSLIYLSQTLLVPMLSLLALVEILVGRWIGCDKARGLSTFNYWPEILSIPPWCPSVLYQGLVGGLIRFFISFLRWGWIRWGKELRANLIRRITCGKI